MTEAAIKLRWVKYNVRGEGFERSLADERYSYRGPTLFSNNWPVARLVEGPGKVWHCLTRTGVHPAKVPDWKPPRILGGTIRVPCIGVYSNLDGDIIPDDKLHARMEWLCHLEAEQIHEFARTWPPNKLLVKPQYGEIGSADLAKKMKAVGARYNEYRGAFNLSWPDWPDYYRTDFDDIIFERSQAYFDPAEVAKRERVVARREAKKALLGDDVDD
jgi:hypothetical protein